MQISAKTGRTLVERKEMIRYFQELSKEKTIVIV